MKFLLLTAANIKINRSWNLTQYSPVDRNQRFGPAYGPDCTASYTTSPYFR